MMKSLLTDELNVQSQQHLGLCSILESHCMLLYIHCILEITNITEKMAHGLGVTLNDIMLCDKAKGILCS